MWRFNFVRLNNFDSMVIRQFIQKDCTAENIAALNALMNQLSPGRRNIEIGEVQQALVSPDLIILVAEDNKKIVGTATLFFQWRLVGDQLAEIHDMVVSETHRGQRVGKKFMEEIMTMIKARATQTRSKIIVMLTSRPRRIAANTLYEQFGFQLSANANGENGRNLYRLTIAP